jgi:two-component system LytT family sensor kinase
MSTKKTSRIASYDILHNRWIYHSLFWLMLLCLLMLLEERQQDFGFLLSNELINLLFYMIIVYFNLYYLVPNYLNRKKFLTYIGLLMLATIIITPIKVIIFYFKFSAIPSSQYHLIMNQHWYFLLTFFIAGSSTIFKIITDWARQLSEKQDLENQTMQSELRFLKSQINPHFLFNTLNNLYALTLKKSDAAPDIVIKLSDIMRYMLYECNEKQVPLIKEVNYIQNYLDLERLRQGKNVEIKFEHRGHVSTQKIAPLMFIPFLENSFKHGLNNNITKGFVNIELSSQPDEVVFFIENSKPDTPPPPDHRRSGGIGLVNVKRRLDLLYPDKYELIIDDNPRTYAVTLKLKLDG